MAKTRIATLSRKTAETDINLKLTIDGTGASQIDTGIPFFDHMLTLFAKHGLFDLEVRARGDVAVDYHHTWRTSAWCWATRSSRRWATRSA